MTEEPNVDPDEKNYGRTIEENTEKDGRSAKIDIKGYYNVQVWGDPNDSLNDVMDQLERAADRVVRDIERLNEIDDSDDRSFD